MTQPIPEPALHQLFLDARTQNGFIDKPVPDDLLRQAFELAKMGPTSANCSPMRVILVQTPEGKARLLPLMAPGNVEKTRSAPITAIIGYDMEFYEQLPKLFPAADARSWFVGNEKLIAEAAFRNGTLQAGYLILALRAVGLDTGPMSGFDNAGVDAEFFAGTAVKSNFICNIGYGDPTKLFPRSPRFAFEEFVQIV